MKKETLDHYDRMIAFANKMRKRDIRSKKNSFSLSAMLTELGEVWTSEYCPLCQAAKGNCRNCPIGQRILLSTSPGLMAEDACYYTPWHRFETATTWIEWMSIAREERAFLESLGDY